MLLRPSPECCRRSFVAGIYNPSYSRPYSTGKSVVVKKKNQDKKIKPGKPTWDGKLYRYSPQSNALKDSPLGLPASQRIREAAENQDVVSKLHAEASLTRTLNTDQIHELARARTYILTEAEKLALEDVVRAESSLALVKELNTALPNHIPAENDFSELRFFSPAGLATANITSPLAKKQKDSAAARAPAGVIRTFGVPSKLVVEFRILNKPFTLLRQISLDLLHWLKNTSSSHSSLESHPNLKLLTGLQLQQVRIQRTTELLTLPLRRQEQELRDAVHAEHPFGFRDIDTKSPNKPGKQKPAQGSPKHTAAKTSNAQETPDALKDMILASAKTSAPQSQPEGGVSQESKGPNSAQSSSPSSPTLEPILEPDATKTPSTEVTEQPADPSKEVEALRVQYQNLILEMKKDMADYVAFRGDALAILRVSENPEERENVKERLENMRDDGKALGSRVDAAREELIALGGVDPAMNEDAFLEWMESQAGTAMPDSDVEGLLTTIDESEQLQEADSLYRLLEPSEVPEYLAIRDNLNERILYFMHEWDALFDDALDGLAAAEAGKDKDLLELIPRDLQAKREERALLTRQLREVELSLFDAGALPDVDDATADLLLEAQIESLSAHDNLLKATIAKHSELNNGTLANRAILTGPPGTGKSHLLLQTVEWAKKSDWIVYYMPRVTELILAANEMPLSKLKTSTERKYWRGPVTSSGLASADLGPVALNAGHINQINQGLLTSEHGELKAEDIDTIPTGTPLVDLIQKGIEYSDASPLFLEWVLDEICGQDTPIFAHNGQTTYRDPRFSRIRSWELSVPRLLLQYASGERKIKKGAFLAALNSSDPQWPIGPELRDAFLLGGKYGSRIQGGSSVFLGEHEPTTGHSEGERTGAGMYEPRSKELVAALQGLTHVPLPERLTINEAKNLYDVWLGTKGVIGSHHDERFHAHFTASEGNPKEFIWNGILRSLDV
ncbi:mitochondrial ribosomal death-associated protein 3-domain-containing protein [Flagelloscypha sp. PMI_526]|nr:mitochondrial ribosomal death-associated protein 3-domain-containing protein [Flagelloscypha sp. PMI_526]